MMSGSPPTERKARTGVFTPPTRSFVARSKISRERRRSRCRLGRAAFISRSKKGEEKNLTQRAQRAQRTQGRLWSPDRVRTTQVGSQELGKKQTIGNSSWCYGQSAERVFMHEPQTKRGPYAMTEERVDVNWISQRLAELEKSKRRLKYVVGTVAAAMCFLLLCQTRAQ